MYLVLLSKYVVQFGRKCYYLNFKNLQKKKKKKKKKERLKKKKNYISQKTCAIKKTCK